MERLWTAMSTGPASARATHRLTPYLLAVILPLAGAVIRLELAPFLHDRNVFLFFIPALIVCAGTGGLLPGLAATALSVLAAAALLTGYGMAAGGWVDNVLFAALGVAIAISGQHYRHARALAADVRQHFLERESHLQSILDTVPDAMIVIDHKGVIRSFSPAAERAFGWTKAEIVGQNVKRLMPSPDREAHDGYLDAYARTGERRIIGIGRVVLAQRKDGSTFPAELCIGQTGAGGAQYFTGFLKDISDRQEAEGRLQTLQSELVHISRLSAMGEMAATLAHELNQPLAAISNYLKGGRRLLALDRPDSPAIGAMDKAAEQALRAGQIIRRLRDFIARGESERKPEQLPKLLEEASALGLMGAKELGVRVHFNRDPSVDCVFVDKVQVQQVVLNLVRNAVEAMEDAPRRELLISVTAEPGDMAMVSIADTGSGISPEIATQLFQPFVTSKGSQGMGVGLSICRTIIDAHGGRIWAEPNPDGGTVFHFTIPRADGEESF